MSGWWRWNGNAEVGALTAAQLAEGRGLTSDARRGERSAGAATERSGPAGGRLTQVPCPPGEPSREGRSRPQGDAITVLSYAAGRRDASPRYLPLTAPLLPLLTSWRV